MPAFNGSTPSAQYHLYHSGTGHTYHYDVRGRKEDEEVQRWTITKVPGRRAEHNQAWNESSSLQNPSPWPLPSVSQSKKPLASSTEKIGAISDRTELADARQRRLTAEAAEERRHPLNNRPYSRPGAVVGVQPSGSFGFGRHGDNDTRKRDHDFVSSEIKQGWSPNTWSVEQLVRYLDRVPVKYYPDFLIRNNVSDEKCTAVYEQCNPEYGKPSRPWDRASVKVEEDPLGHDNWWHFTAVRSKFENARKVYDRNHNAAVRGEFQSASPIYNRKLKEISPEDQALIESKIAAFFSSKNGGPGAL